MKHIIFRTNSQHNEVPTNHGQYLVKYFIDDKWQLATYKPVRGIWTDEANGGVHKPDPMKWVSLHAI